VTYVTELYEELGLTKKEYGKIVEILGREPNYVELAMYSVMWSEHCSYKSSKPVLKLFPTYGPQVIQGPGENAGIVDIGDNLAVALKIESHNHPSAIEPYQGAATGVGGILRDIFAMGARPIALLDPLRFGSLGKPRVKYLFEEVIAGIAGYGNCCGVPTVAGDVYFEDAYEGNPLVNVMCVGLVEKGKIMRGQARGEGNLVILIGNKTGRDGIGGVSVLASQELAEEAYAKRPSVQVGDPFTEKLLIEACLELDEEGLLVGLQDLGGAGLTCATCETASRAGMGMDIDISKVLRREKGMEAFEVMVSESQERMLAIVKPEDEEEVLSVCQKWGLDATTIGRVTKGTKLRIFEDGNLVASMPARSLADEAPVYYRRAERPAYLSEVQNLDITTIKHPADLNKVLLDLLASPNICSRHWIYEQYDHMVQTNTAALPGSDAAVLRIKGTKKAIALTADSNGRYCYIDPYVGAQIAVAEAARNVVCSGAKPLAITDCLNFGNPEKPQIFWQFKEAVRGMAEACQKLGTPVVGGNVSFYNEWAKGSVYPTPVVGMLGLISDLSKHITMAFKEPRDLIAILGETRPELGGSEYLKVVHNLIKGKPPELDLERERAVQQCLLEANNNRLIRSAHDLSEGGLAVALAECCIAGDVGAQIRSPLTSHGERVNWLFSESQSRILISLRDRNLFLLERLAKRFGVPLSILGRVSGKKLVINDTINLPVEDMARVWRGALEQWVES
jgi:phosphoribosylformylglycinamidine synthase